MTKIHKDNNNNAVPVTSTQRSKIFDRSKSSKTNFKNNRDVKKITPIIETRGMKARKVLASSEFQELNKIDSLTNREILDGDSALDPEEICHDGVEISINGSDVDEFLEENDGNDGSSDMGEISSGDEDEASMVEQRKIASKVVKVSTDNTSSSQPGKFDHLKNDPEF